MSCVRNLILRKLTEFSQYKFKMELDIPYKTVYSKSYKLIKGDINYELYIKKFIPCFGQE